MIIGCVWIIDKCKKERVLAINYLYIPVKRRGCERDATAARIARSEPNRRSHRQMMSQCESASRGDEGEDEGG